MKHENIEDIYELSPMQQGMFFHSLYAPESEVYFVQLCCTIQGALNIPAFERAWQRVADRHPILRTAFHWGEIEKPLQVVYRRVKLPIEQQDWRDLSLTEQEKRLEAFLKADRRRGFNLSQAPLMRLLLIRTAEDSHQFVWGHHHMLLDGWSVPLVVKEVLAFYEAFCRGQDLHLKQPRPYRDYIGWLQQQELSKAEAFWRQTLKGFTAPTPLGTDRTPGSSLSQEESYDDLEIKLSPATTAALQSLARQHQLTLSNLVQGAWALLLSRYSGEEDVVFGTVSSGRPAELAGVESMVGLFINTLPLRVQVPPEAPLIPWLRKLQDHQAEMRQYEYSPLVQVQRGSNVPRGMPLFESILAFENYPVYASLQEQGGSLEIQNAHMTSRAHYPLTVVAWSAPELTLKIEYDCRRFDASTITRMIGHFQTLLEVIAVDPEQRLSGLTLLTDSERHQLLVEWNDTRTEYPKDKCVHEMFEAQVTQTPDAAAVVFGDQYLTYRELNHRANQLAHHLQALGVGPEVLVGVCMEPSLEMMVGLLGLLKAGGAYIPLDPADPKERLAFMLADVQVRVLLSQEQLVPELPEHEARVVCLNSDWPVIAQESEENPVSAVRAENAAYVIYTSGSTGRPKGVLVTHRSLVNYLWWVNTTLFNDMACILPAITKLTFDASLKQLFAPLLEGREVWLFPGDVTTRPATLLQALSTRSKVGLNCVPSLWEAMLDTIDSLEDVTLAAPIAHLLVGGDMLSQKLVNRSLTTLPHLQVWNLYGPTEATANASVAQITLADEVTIGRPIANAQLYILDRHLQPMPVGVPGELHIGGVGLARGYLNRPELTAEKFIPSPFSDEPGARLYKTGDLARYLPDGNIELLGRIDHQVKIRGFRIELGEIEAVLGQHPAVRETVVLAREDEPGDPSSQLRTGKCLVAYVVPAQEPAPTVSELCRFLAKKLPGYMVPSAFVMLDALPLTPSGKVDRRGLPAPDGVRPELEKAFVAPRTELERFLAKIWRETLKIEQIGVHDSFFELGGDSIKATLLVNTLQKELGEPIYIVALFDAPNIVDLAVYLSEHHPAAVSRVLGLESLPGPEFEEEIVALDQAERGKELSNAMPTPKEGYTPIQPLPRDTGTYLPLSFAQQRLWFLDQLVPNNPFYNVPAAVRLRGRLNVMALERSFNEIVRRHEALRTTLPTVEGRPIQVIAPSLTPKLPVVDLREFAEEQREVEARRLATEEAQRPFNLAQGPLLRTTLLRLNEEEHILLLTMHHIVSDDWSARVFIKEVVALYEAFSTGKPSPLPELPIQYADFAHWQREWLQGDVLEEQLAYWRQQLGGSLPVLTLPTDRPRPVVQTFQGATQSFVLSTTLSEALKVLGQQEGATLFMTLLAAFKTLLYRYTGQEDIVVGSPIANRNRPEIEGLIGFFVNMLVLRTDLSGNPTFRELLGRVREVALGAYAHQDLPFEKLVDELQPERDRGHAPLFQVGFTLQNAPSPSLKLPGLTLTPLEIESGTAKYDLLLSMIDAGQGLLGLLEYNTDLFDAATISRMAGHFQTLLESVVANPEQRLAEMPLLTQAEHRQLLEEWNDTRTEYPKDKCIHELFEAQVERTPDAVAVIFDGQHLSYQELNCRANQLAHHLQALGVGPEVLVGICVERSLEMVVGVLAILKAGGAYVPLDPTYPRKRLAFMLEDARAPVLLTQERLVKRLPEHKPEVVRLDADWESIAQENRENPVSGVTADNLAYVIYTSGSTGKPKGVLVGHRGLCNLAEAQIQAFDMHAASRVLQFASLSFDASASEVFTTLLAGATLCLGTQESLLPGPALIRLLRDQAITTVTLPPSVLAVLPAEELPALRTIISAGETCPADVVARWSAGGRFLNAYGPTEATVCATIAECIDSNRRPPIGGPIANIQVYILDSHLQAVPLGVPGELCIGGVSLARGYLNRPELTAEKFVPHPFPPSIPPIGREERGGARLYKTGDLARYLPDGNIEFLGRIDHQVKVRGFRIELGEIEVALRQHPAVREVVVLAREDDPGDKRLIAYVVPNEEQETTVSELRHFLRGKLPNYMVPSAFVMLEALPLTPNGKVDRRALLALGEARLELQRDFVAPRDTLELQLTQIWEDLLDMRPIGVTDSFFDLGGNSLLAVHLTAQIQKQFGRNLSLSILFEAGTIEHMARVLREQTDALPWSPLVTIQPAGSKRPFFCVHPGLGIALCYVDLARHLGLDQPFYGLQARGLDGEQEPFTRIEDMAAYYIEAMRLVQPEGPYLLGGHSLGGLVAFEMAQQLHRQGDQVALLALLDVAPPVSVPTDIDIDDVELLVELAEVIERFWGKELSVSYSDLRELGPNEQLNYLLERLRKINLVPPGAGLSMIRSLWQVVKANNRASLSYVPQVYAGRIILFRARETASEIAKDLGIAPQGLEGTPKKSVFGAIRRRWRQAMYILRSLQEQRHLTLRQVRNSMHAYKMIEIGARDPAWGWGDLSTEPVEVHFVPGHHVSMISEPHVRVLAERLKVCLDKDYNNEFSRKVFGNAHSPVLGASPVQ